jgi:hypothetical protein
MGDAFRRLFLSIGVALGLASGQSDPSLYSQAAFSGDRLVVSARVENAFAPGALELVEAGTKIALRFSAEIEGTTRGTLAAEETRFLWYDLRSGLYDVVFDGGKTAALVDPQAARTLVSETPALVLCLASEARENSRIVVKAQIGIIDSSGAWHDAPVLWNYFAPKMSLTSGRPAEGAAK